MPATWLADSSRACCSKQRPVCCIHRLNLPWTSALRSLPGCHRARKGGAQPVTAHNVHESKRVGEL